MKASTSDLPYSQLCYAAGLFKMAYGKIDFFAHDILCCAKWGYGVVKFGCGVTKCDVA